MSPPCRIRAPPAPASPMRTTFFFAALLLVAALARSSRRAPSQRDDHRPPLTRGYGHPRRRLAQRRRRAATCRLRLPHWKIVANDRVGRTTDRGDRRARGRPAAPSRRTSSSASAPTTRRRMSRRSAPTWHASCELDRGRTDASSGRRSGATGGRTTRSTTSSARRPNRTDRVRLVEWAAMVRAAPRLARRRRPARQRDGLS